MSISIADLGPEAQKQALQQLAGKRSAERTKYGAVRTEVNGVSFDSKKEARRYGELMLLLKAGKIHELKLQPQFTLQEAYTTPEGNRVRAIRYQADFSYNTGAGLVVEDVKSRATKTRVYGIKKKLMREKFGIEVQEI